MKKNINSQKIKWFIIWVIIFFGLMGIFQIILTRLQGQFNFLNNDISYYIFMGLMLAFFSKLINSAIRKKNFSVNTDILYWALIYACSLWLVKFIIGILIANLEFSMLQNEWIILSLLALGIEFIAVFLRRANFGRRRGGFRLSRMPGWLLWIIIIIGIIILIQLYVPYGSPKTLSGGGLSCNNGKVVQASGGLLGNLMGSLSGFEASVTCLEYKSSRCRYVCVENKPACQCETALIHRLFTRQVEWIFGG